MMKASAGPAGRNRADERAVTPATVEGDYRMTSRVAPLLLPCVLTLAACANPGAQLALKAPETLVGMPKSALLSCAGVPERTADADGAEYLTYSREQTIVEREVDYEPFPWAGPGVFRPEVSTWSRSYRCDATFVVRDGRVQELRYNQNRDITLCYAILANCLPSPPAR